MMANNLESTINKIGHEISQVLKEQEINKLLGVLANDGVFAMWIYVRSKKDIDENKLMEKIKPIFSYVKEMESDGFQKYFEELSKNLNDLLFFREILEKVLIYARYHAKAMGDS